MKVACDICEKVEDEYRASGWLQVNTKYSKFLLCDKCEDKFWNIFKKDEQKAEVSKNANEP